MDRGAVEPVWSQVSGGHPVSLVRPGGRSDRVLAIAFSIPYLFRQLGALALCGGQCHAVDIRMISRSPFLSSSSRASPGTLAAPAGRAAALCPADLCQRPEDTVLFRTLEGHLETFLAGTSDQGGGNGLPAFVTRELRAYLRCGRPEHGCVHVRASSAAMKWSWRSAATGVASAPRAGAAV